MTHRKSRPGGADPPEFCCPARSVPVRRGKEAARDAENPRSRSFSEYLSLSLKPVLVNTRRGSSPAIGGCNEGVWSVRRPIRTAAINPYEVEQLAGNLQSAADAILDFLRTIKTANAIRFLDETKPGR
jgi:hypothetical protein